MTRYTEKERLTLQTTTRQKLLTAALDAFARCGYENANINQISLAAGFAKGTIYNYFTGKQDLMDCVIAEVSQDHIAFIHSQVMEVDDARERVRCFYRAGFQYVCDHPAAVRLMLAMLNSPDTHFQERMAAAYQPLFDMVGGEILAAGASAGCFQPEHLPLHTTLMLTIYLGSASRVDERGQTLLDSSAVADFVLNALRK